VRRSEIGPVPGERGHPLLAGVIEVLGDQVGGVAFAAASHPDVGRRRGRVLAEHEVPGRGGVTLRAVSGGGVGEFDMFAYVVEGKHADARCGGGDGERAVAVHHGDGPGVAVRDTEGVVVAAGGDQVTDADWLSGAGAGGVLIVDHAGRGEPVADRGIQYSGLLAGVDHDRGRTPGTMVGGSVFSDRLLPLVVAAVHGDLPASNEGVEHAGRVLSQAHLQRQVRVDVVRHPFALTGRAERLAGEPMLVDEPRRRPGSRPGFLRRRLGRLQRRSDNDKTVSLSFQLLMSGREQRGLTGPRGAFDHHQSRRPGQRGDRFGLAWVEPVSVQRERARTVGGVGRFSAAHRKPRDQVGLDIQHPLRGEYPHVLRRALFSQRDTPCQGAGGEVFGQLKTHCRVGDDPAAGDEVFDLAADISRVPRRPPGTEARDHLGHRHVAVEPTRPGQCQLDRSVGVSIAERGEFAQPAAMHLGTRFGDHLVRAAIGPRAGIPGSPQPWSRLIAGICSAPLGFVPVDVGRDLRRASGEGPDEVGELLDLTVGVEGVAMRGERCTELRVANDSGVPDGASS
jgi:hypothetical protein